MTRPAGRRSALTIAIGRRAVALLLAGALFTNLAAVSLWSWRVFASSQGFADAVTDMLKEPAVRQLVASQIVTTLEQQAVTEQASVNVRPLLEQVVSQVVSTDAFQGIFHAGVRELHAAVVQGHRTRLLVRVDDASQLVKDGLRAISPSLADSIPDTALQVVVGLSQSAPVDRFIRVSELAGWLAGPFAVVAIACFVGAARVAESRRRAIEAEGTSLIISGIMGFVTLGLVLNVTATLGRDPLQRTALRAVFWSTVHLLNIEAKVAITVGAVVALAALYAGRDVRAQAQTAWQAVWDRLERRPWKAGVSIGLIALAVLALTWPAAAAAVLTRLLAFAALVVGAVGLLDLVGSHSWSTPSSTVLQRAARRWAVTATATVLGASAIVLFGGMSFARGVAAPRARHPSIAATGCNGHLELCDRRLDQVAFVGTHNSMSGSTEPGWLFTRHAGGIAAQLARGVRAFLIDFHYGARTAQLVRTDFRSEGEKAALTAQLPPSERAVTDRLLGVLGAAPPEDQRRVYLCHVYCELGATDAVTALRLVNDFLVENPNEVIILDIEDHVSQADAIDALKRSGLARRALRWTPGTPFPTLREMIESHHNVLVMAENEGGGEPWYIPAYDRALQETPYDFATVRDFSCALNRGKQANPLLLVNHWVGADPPSPARAAEANAASVLRARLEQCTRERGHVPNIVAVDFYNRGDVFAAVDELNDVGGASTTSR